MCQTVNEHAKLDIEYLKSNIKSNVFSNHLLFVKYTHWQSNINQKYAETQKMLKLIPLSWYNSDLY